MIREGLYQWSWDPPPEGWEPVVNNVGKWGVRGWLWRKETEVNSIQVIAPYKYQGAWVFDDASTGLVREPFVAGMDKIIDALVENIPDAANGFLLFFAAAPFPGKTLALNWRREECGGNWYYSEALGQEGWLCPALFHYFDRAPKTLYAQGRGRI